MVVLQISEGTQLNELMRGPLLQRKYFLKTDYFNAEWCLPSRVSDNPMLWMVSINGLPVDARMLSVEIQEICYEKGLIAYVPAYGD